VTTLTKENTLQEELERSSPNTIADALRLTDLGKMLATVKVVVVGLTDVAAQDITTAAFKALATITGTLLETGENLPAIGNVVSLRSTAGTLAVQGTHVVSDTGGTPLVPSATFPGVATLSDDGKTITFQAGVTAFVLVYNPVSKTALSTSFKQTGI